MMPLGFGSWFLVSVREMWTAAQCPSQILHHMHHHWHHHRHQTCHRSYLPPNSPASNHEPVQVKLRMKSGYSTCTRQLKASTANFSPSFLVHHPHSLGQRANTTCSNKTSNDSAECTLSSSSRHNSSPENRLFFFATVGKSPVCAMVMSQSSRPDARFDMAVFPQTSTIECQDSSH